MKVTSPQRGETLVGLMVGLGLGLLVLAAGKGAIALGLALDPFALTVLVVNAALPSASNVALLAERFGADTGRIARIILLTTVVAFLSFSGAVALMT